MPFDCNFSKNKHHLFLKFVGRKYTDFEQNFFQLVVDQLLSSLTRASKDLLKCSEHGILYVSYKSKQKINLDNYANSQ